MHPRKITYENFDGEKVTETFYFNISKPELIELQVEVEGGFGEFLQRIVKAENHKAIVHEMKRIILMAYGVKSDDGRRFMKSPEISKAFEESAAYEVLFMDLATDDKVAADFITAILPKDVEKEFEKAAKQSEAPKPPTPPALPNS